MKKPLTLTNQQIEYLEKICNILFSKYKIEIQLFNDNIRSIKEVYVTIKDIQTYESYNIHWFEFAIRFIGPEIAKHFGHEFYFSEKQIHHIIDASYSAIQDLKKRWHTFKILGTYFGYPKCCINYFIENAGAIGNPVGVKKSENTGFLPCPTCCNKLNNNSQLKLKDLLINRKHPQEFPLDFLDEEMYKEIFTNAELSEL